MDSVQRRALAPIVLGLKLPRTNQKTERTHERKVERNLDNMWEDPGHRERFESEEQNLVMYW